MSHPSPFGGRRTAPLAAALLVSTAVAAAPFVTDQEHPAAPPVEPTSAPAEGDVTQLPAAALNAYRLELQAPRRLRELLSRHLDLARFRKQTDISPIELGRLVAATPAQVRRLLEPEGYFDAQVTVQRTDAADGSPPLLRVKVEPGVQARVGRVQLELQGPLADAIEKGDREARRRWQRLQTAWGLPQDAPFTQAAWEEAKATLLSNLQSRGHASASLVGTGAEVDAEQATVRLFVVIDSGPAYRIGEVRVEGLQHTPVSAALNVRPFKYGTPYTEKLLLDYQEALQRTGLYDGIAVELDADPERADHAAVLVRLREQKAQSATVSVGFSSNTGPRTGLEHVHRRPFGRDLVASTKLQLGRDERSLSLDLLSYPLPGHVRNLLGVHADYLDAGGAVTQTQRLRAGRRHDGERIDRLYYLELNRTTVDTVLTRSADYALWANYEWVRRDVNNIVFPTRGLTLNAQGGGGVADDGDGSQGPFLRLYLQATWYQPLGNGWYAQLRTEGAQLFRRNTLGIPDSLLFRAGGDNSVRGYGYRTLGPRREGSVVGGSVMATGSAELMHQLAREGRWRDWFGAVFVDAGNAADHWNDWSAVIGYGLGLRWRSPVGPLRTDLAYGHDVSAWRLHVSLGITY